MIKILHVDDEADIRAITKLALESIGGFNVTSCASGTEAIATVALQNIPDANQIPVIFMTAKTQKDEIESLMALGAIGVIAKPFDPVQLSKEVERIWSARTSG